jgi:hypothetical protein
MADKGRSENNSTVHSLQTVLDFGTTRYASAAAPLRFLWFNKENDLLQCAGGISLRMSFDGGMFNA